MSDTFEDHYSSTCEDCGNDLEWEWDGDDLNFKATCSCMKTHTLTPTTGVMQVMEEQEDIEEDDE